MTYLLGGSCARGSTWPIGTTSAIAPQLSASRAVKAKFLYLVK